MTTYSCCWYFKILMLSILKATKKVCYKDSYFSDSFCADKTIPGLSSRIERVKVILFLLYIDDN